MYIFVFWATLSLSKKNSPMFPKADKKLHSFHLWRVLPPSYKLLTIAICFSWPLISSISLFAKYLVSDTFFRLKIVLKNWLCFDFSQVSEADRPFHPSDVAHFPAIKKEFGETFDEFPHCKNKSIFQAFWWTFFWHPGKCISNLWYQVGWFLVFRIFFLFGNILHYFLTNFLDRPPHWQRALRPPRPPRSSTWGWPQQVW